MSDNPYQHTPEWHRARRGKLTSSRMKTIVHGGPRAWTTLIGKLQAELASDVILEPDLDFVPAIAHGRKYEPIARANVEMDLGLDFDLVGFVTHPEFDFIGCSSDALAPDRSFNWECKCPFNVDRHRVVYQTRRMPDEHRPQVQCQMFVHGIDRTLFTSYHPGEPHWKMRTINVEVKLDQRYVDYMVLRCEQFMSAFRGESSVVRKAILVPDLF